MRNTITMAAGILLLLGTISVAQAASQQIIGTTLESYSDQPVCTNTTFCVLNFPQLPAGKNYIIQRVRCRVVAPATPVYMFFGVASQVGASSLIKRTYFEQISSSYAQSNYFFTYEAIPLMMMGPGKYPTVTYQTAATSAQIQVECALGGNTL